MRIRVLSLVFLSGAAGMAIEMCAARLLAPYFGTSQVVWANLIGLILLYLSAGYFLGGRLADRCPSERALALLLLLAAGFMALIPLLSGPLLRQGGIGVSQASVGILLGSLESVLLLFLVPVTLLGMVPPFAIRLTMTQLQKAGSSSGRIYMLSTLGSIVGTFAPVFWLIPTIGTRRSFLVLAVLLFLASAWSLLARSGFMARSAQAGMARPPRLGQMAAQAVLALALLVPAGALSAAPLGPLRALPGMIYEQESLYNYIQVTQASDGTRELILNEGQAVHSIYNPRQLLTGWYWDYFLAAPFFNSGFQPSQLHRMAIIGLAGGTIARQFSAAYPQVQIDGVEIDPAIVDVARQYFGMNAANEPHLHVFEQDGRAFARQTRASYDVIAIDAFQQPYIPFHLTTEEFFSELRDHLADDGVLALNTGHTRTNFRLVQAFVNTLSRVFPSVYVFLVPGTFNAEIMATKHPTNLTTFRQNMMALRPDSLLGQVAQEVVPQVSIWRTDGGVVFTDDRAPVEQLTNDLLISYAEGN